jgi:predicted DNA-binding WGR domain protein
MVEMSYGRIGTTGRSKIRSFPHVDDARAQVRSCLKRRATAPRRIGVGYQMRGQAWLRCEAQAHENREIANYDMMLDRLREFLHRLNT